MPGTGRIIRGVSACDDRAPSLHWLGVSGAAGGSTSQVTRTRFKQALETQRGVAAPYIGSGRCRIWCLPLGGSATHGRLQHWRWENISAQALELLIWINRKSQLTISVICLKLLYQNIIEPTDLVHKHAHLHRIAFGKTIIKISSGPIWIMLGI